MFYRPRHKAQRVKEFENLPEIIISMVGFVAFWFVLFWIALT